MRLIAGKLPDAVRVLGSEQIYECTECGRAVFPSSIRYEFTPNSEGGWFGEVRLTQPLRPCGHQSGLRLIARGTVEL